MLIRLYRFDLDNTIPCIVHHGLQQLLESFKLDAVMHRPPFVCHTQHKCYSVLKCPDLQVSTTMHKVTFIPLKPVSVYTETKIALMF